tara:strand:- start:43 stop:504 length:462 start_codon:yes stop_codon:yes gene_type:complete
MVEDTKLIIIDEFFTKHQYLKILLDSKKNWELRPKGVYKDLKDSFYVKECVEHIGKKLNKSISLYRAYSHGFRRDLLPGIHKDVNATHTALFFVNDVYDPNWLGGTIVYTDKPNYVEFKSNRMVIFESGLDHTGTPLLCDDFRIQCIWKINIV